MPPPMVSLKMVMIENESRITTIPATPQITALFAFSTFVGSPRAVKYSKPAIMNIIMISATTIGHIRLKRLLMIPLTVMGTLPGIGSSAIAMMVKGNTSNSASASSMDNCFFIIFCFSRLCGKRTRFPQSRH